jgi:hypothetical protein
MRRVLSVLTVCALSASACGPDSITSAPELRAPTAVQLAKSTSLPNPKLVLDSRTPTQFDNGSGGFFYHFELSVRNYTSYSDAMFAPSPNLPACGLNTSASRTWVDVFDQNGGFLNGFCSLASASDLNQLWFPVTQGAGTPTQVVIVLTDRLTNTTYTSNPIKVPAF